MNIIEKLRAEAIDILKITSNDDSRPRTFPPDTEEYIAYYIADYLEICDKKAPPVPYLFH